MKTVISAAAAVLGAGLLTFGHAAATSQDCPPGQTAANCVKGTVIVWEDPSHPAGNQFIQEDNSGAPQFWVGVGGAASGANPFCVTDKTVVHFVACIGGPWGNGEGKPLVTLFDEQHQPVSLTIADLRFLHWLEKTHVGHRQTS